MTIPNEIIIPLFPILAGAIAAIWHAWRQAEKECDALREKQVTDAKSAAEILTEQRIANVGALSTITMREFERDMHKERADRCERENERLKESSSKRPPS